MDRVLRISVSWDTYPIGKSPKENRNDHVAPKLFHDIKQTEWPYLKNGKGTKKARTQKL